MKSWIKLNKSSNSYRGISYQVICFWFLLVMQIAITLNKFYFQKCLGLYYTWSQYHPGDDNLYSCYVIFLNDNDVSRRIKTSLLKFSTAQDHLSLPSNELHLYPLHSFWLMNPFFHHTNQTLLLWSENIHNTVNHLGVDWVESLKFEAEQQNYMWQSSIFISGKAVFQIRGSQVKNVSLMIQYGQIQVKTWYFWE